MENKTKSSIRQSRSESSQSRFDSSQSRSESSSQCRFDSSQSRGESSSQCRFDSSQSRSFEASLDSVERFSESREDRSREKTVRTYSNKDTSVSMPLEEESSVYVNPVSKKEDGSRRYNKKHHCLYCGEAVQKMSRHLSRRHSDVVEVAKALSLPKNSKERRSKTLNITLKFWRAAKANSSHGSSQRKKLKDKNLCTVFTATDCSEKE